MIQRLQVKSLSDNLPSAKDVPLLIPDKDFEVIKTDKDGKPVELYEFVEAVKVPADGTGGIYSADYFKSLLEYLKTKPIPGSKDGHLDRLQDDFFTVGGVLEMANETEGRCCFRVAVPPQGWNGSNEALIRSIRLRIPELSIVADVEGAYGNDGRIYFHKELGKPRNDLVDEGAMVQSLGNKKDAKEKNGMNKEEIFNAVKTALANTLFSFEELAEFVKLDNRVRNATDEQREKLAEFIRETLELPANASIAEISKAVADAFKDIEESADAVAESELNRLTGGHRRRNAFGVEEPNPLYAYGKDKLKGARGIKQVNRTLRDLQDDPVFKDLRSKNADPYSAANSGGYVPPRKQYREV